jgi:hypothetical protein
MIKIVEDLLANGAAAAIAYLGIQQRVEWRIKYLKLISHVFSTFYSFHKR